MMKAFYRVRMIANHRDTSTVPIVPLMACQSPQQALLPIITFHKHIQSTDVVSSHVVRES